MTPAELHAAAIATCRDAGATCSTCEWWDGPIVWCRLFISNAPADHTCAAWAPKETT